MNAPARTSGPGPQWVEPASSAEHSADVRAAFVAAFDAEPDGVWAAPGRVNLIGEHLDYNGGPVLPIAIEHRTMIAVSARTDGQIRLRSIQDPATWQGAIHDLAPNLDNVDSTAAPGMPQWCRYAAGVLWALRQDGHKLPGLDVMVDGRVPSGSGLSSSAALTCAVAVAAADLAGIDGSDPRSRPRMLARACVRAENDFAGAPTGGMDQAVVLRARAGHALLLDCVTFEAEHVAIPSDADLLVVDTRTHHALSDGQYGGRRAACEHAATELSVPTLASIDPTDLAEALSRLSSDELRAVVRHVVTETARVHAIVSHLRADRLADIGSILLASHASMRDDFRISTPELDLVVDSAVRSGALGARMTGGGFGGSAVVLCRPGDRSAVAGSIARAFEQAGCGAPGMLAVQASGPAARVHAD